MTRPILFVGIAFLTCASFAPEAFAQSNQTVNPVPITPPSLNTTTLTCQINCDTHPRVACAPRPRSALAGIAAFGHLLARSAILADLLAVTDEALE
jgi:hypothetical protein